MPEPLPDLTFPSATYGPNEHPLDLKPLLFRGGARARSTEFQSAAEGGRLGPLLRARLPLVEGLHETFVAKLVAGGSLFSTRAHVRNIRKFYTFADRLGTHGESPTIHNAVALFCRFVDHQRRLRHKRETVYGTCASIAQSLAPALGMQSRALLGRAKLRSPPNQLSQKSEKSGLQEVFEFVRFLREITSALSVETVRGPIPVVLHFSEGRKHELACSLRKPKKNARPSVRQARIHQLSNDLAIWKRHRSPLVNLRLDAEFHIFVQQTGANRAPARKLRNEKWRYHSRDGMVEMTAFKGRANKEVVFSVYPEFRKHFNTYLSWRNELFGLDPKGLLFPFVRPRQGNSESALFLRLRELCKELGQPYFSPGVLRKSSGNWMERNQAGRGPDFLQNTPGVFDGRYRHMSHQKALVEITHFWRGTKRMLTPAAGPGGCATQQPKLQPNADQHAPKPDCLTAGACLFCESNRDLESFDHVWQLASLRALAMRELACETGKNARGTDHPKYAVITRIAEKFVAFRKLGDKWLRWLDEAEKRMAAEHYHDVFVEQWQIISMNRVHNHAST